jgi:beta-carotene 3-hydroxylase
MDAAAKRNYLVDMGDTWLIPLLIVLLTVVGMELVASAVHRFVMHGPGWGWHRSHHEPGHGLFERNDLYALVFAFVSLGLFVAGMRWPALWWVGLGTVIYGLLYAILHDGLVHQRFPFIKSPRSGYLKRLVQAHRMHHSVRGREGTVSFGFIYAPPVRKLREQLRRDPR